MSRATAFVWAVILGLAPGAALGREAGPAESAREILALAGVPGGLVVHLGCGTGQLTAALRASDSYLVQGLDRDAKNVAAARTHVDTLGLYGPVSIDRLTGPGLPYIDNLVNLLVVEDPSLASDEEIRRVLAPEGVACVKRGRQWTKIVKPRPKEIDDWTHYLYDASNNAVAHDEHVGPPRHLQWICGPNWSRHHDHMASLSAMVSAGARVFYIMDEGPRESILLPSQWFLVARDAFSGTLLWKRPIPQWNTQLWPLKSGPNQLPRRLVAVGDRVYVTLGIDAPVEVLDAATGRTVVTCPGTGQTDEIVAHHGTLFLLVAREPNKWKDYRPNSTYVWDNTKRANSQWAWDKANRWLMAVAADSGRTLWKQDARVAPLTLGVDAQRVYYYDDEHVVAVDRNTGRTLWTSETIAHKSIFPTGYGPTLVVHGDVILLSVENKSMTGLSASDGRILWTAPHHRGGHMSPDDMLVVDNLVWSGAVANGADSGVFTGRDVRTGEVKCEFPPNVNPPWFHHRCYRSRATDKYFIASRTGLEYIDLAAKRWDINHWVRGGCLYGFMPANGLTYVPPQACGCFLESKLFGFNALAADAPSRRVAEKAAEADRLERGPAYGQGAGPEGEGPGDWPTYRADAARSGAAKTAVPVELGSQWETTLGGRLSSVAVAGGRLFVAAVDAQAVHALDAADGSKLWRFTAGARVDSPPTFFRGRVLFGSADGWVYCLRAADGALAWRYRAAPADRRLVAYDQLESAWPVSGSVLVEKDGVWCVAGRSAFLDGGMRLVRLDSLTGRKISETVIDDRDPETGENLQSLMQAQDMPVALPDVLSSDGRSIYMRSQAFDLEGVRRVVAPLRLGANRRGTKDAAESDEPLAAVGNHLFSRSGFLDDSWFWRSYWVFGRHVDSNYGGWLLPAHFAPSGRLMVFDDEQVYGFGRQPQYQCNASVAEYYLYAASRTYDDADAERVRSATGRINAASVQRSASSSDWATRKKFSLSEQSVARYKWAAGRPPIQARGLVLAGQTLFMAGPPDLLDEEEAFRNPDDPAVQRQLEAQAAALRGRKGGQLVAVSAADGRTLAAYELGAMPTFDGMAAAGGRLFLSTVDGRVICLGKEGRPLAPAARVELAALDTSVKESDVAPALRAGPDKNGDFDVRLEASVTGCDVGYHVYSASKKIGLAVQKLAEPLTGKFTLTSRMRTTPDGQLKNCFLVFGDAPQDDRLVKCGLRYAMSKAMIVEGPISGRAASETFEPDPERVYDVRITVDLEAGNVTMKVGPCTVTRTLKRVPERVTHVGFAVVNAAAEFAPIEVGR